MSNGKRRTRVQSVRVQSSRCVTDTSSFGTRLLCRRRNKTPTNKVPVETIPAAPSICGHSRRAPILKTGSHSRSGYGCTAKISRYLSLRRFFQMPQSGIPALGEKDQEPRIAMGVTMVQTGCNWVRMNWLAGESENRGCWHCETRSGLDCSSAGPRM